MKFIRKPPIFLAVTALPNPAVFSSLTELLKRVLDILLVFGGAVVVLMIGYSAILFMTSGGDPTRRGNAKKVLLWTIIGLTVIVTSWLIITTIAGFFGVSVEKP